MGEQGCKGDQTWTILDPTLLKIDINNVAHAASGCHIHLYADDTILYTSSSSLNTTLLHSFNSIQHAFSNLHLLLINTTKTKCLVFNRHLP